MFTGVIHKGKRIPLLSSQKNKGVTKIISNGGRKREYGEKITIYLFFKRFATLKTELSKLYTKET